VAVYSVLASASTVQVKTLRRSHPKVLRGGLPAVPVNLARLDPGWWRATTPTTTIVPAVVAKKEDAADGVPTTTAKPGLFDVKIEMCTAFLNMPGTFIANEEYWKNECKVIPTKATYLKLTAGDVTDYFKPKDKKSMCDMLGSKDQHMWGSDGFTWVTPAASTAGLGGSADGWLTKQKLENDKRDTPTFWGGRGQTGGCCHADYKSEGKGWAKPYKMEYCGLPEALAPICTPLTTVEGSFQADKDFWANACKAIPMTTAFVKIAMGDTVDYFRPTTGKTYCDMLTSGISPVHKWSKDGDTWVDMAGKYETGPNFGGSMVKAVETGDARNHVPFWGSSKPGNTGGCCYAAPEAKEPIGFGKGFTMSYCEQATAPPVNQLVELLRSSEAGVAALEKDLGSLHTRLSTAENVNVEAAGNVSLAQAGMYKLAVKAQSEADELGVFQLRSSMAGSNLDQAENQLKAAEKTVVSGAKSAKATAVIAKKVASPEYLLAQDTLNDQMWKLLDPTNKDSLDATEKRVGAMEEDTRKFKKKLGNEVKSILVGKMRRSVRRLRKVIHRLGVAGRKSSEDQLGVTESGAPLGSDLGLVDES